MKFPWRFFQSVQWKVVIIYILLILIAVQVIGAYFIREVEAYYVNNFTKTLNTQTKLLAANLERYLDYGDEKDNAQEEDLKRDIDYLVDNLFALNAAELQIIDQNGVVISATGDNRGIIGQKNTQTEVNLALNGTRDETIRIDPDTGRRMKVLAIPIKKDNKILGAIYLVASMEEMYQTIGEINEIFASGTIIALLLTAALGVLLSRTITSPVKEITTQASAMADGDFDRTVKIYSGDEIGQLAKAFNFLTFRLKEALSQNEKEKEKLSSILSNMTEGVIAADQKGRIILMNQRAAGMLKMNEEEALGKTLFQLLELPEDEEITAIIQNNESLLLENAHSSGPFYLIRVFFSSLQGIAEEGSGVIAVLQDVTEQEKLERDRKEFVANVSHELRTPLTTMKSYIEALHDGAFKDRELAPKFLNVTLNETDRMIRLVNDLLQLSRLDSEAVRLNKKETNINQMIQDTAERFSVQLEQQQLSLQVESDRLIPKVFIDHDMINQVLDNLISNAIKYSSTGGEIGIKIRKKKDRVSVTVKDNGQGIPEEDLARVFDRFYRVDKARSRSMGGTGLGLSISQEIIHLHGGTIHLESEMQKGTEVKFDLPLYEPAEEQKGRYGRNTP